VDWQSLRLSLWLAVATGVVLLPTGVLVGRWLARSTHPLKPIAEATLALPLILPPTVLGYYLLVALGGQSPVGQLYAKVAGHPLAFSFAGLLVASVIFNIPFAWIPTQRAFESIPADLYDAARSCGLSRWRTLWRIELPLAWRGILSGLIMTLAHTLGEFGVVLMVGGNIPGRTKVISIAIYEHVETLEYAQAHILSAGLLVFSFAVLLSVYILNRRMPLVRV
jgi:molybdate transport system permease protein